MSINLVSMVLLVSVTFLYSGYNLFIKMSGSQVPEAATTTVLATICLQVAALVVSLVFLICLIVKGGQTFRLNTGAYQWATVAGVCIGMAEIGYFYLFAGLQGSSPMAAGVAIPVIVGGTIAVAMVFSFFVLREQLGVSQLIGSLLIVCGIVFLFINAKPAISG